MPICVFDIAPDGAASAPDDHLPKSGYRWWHFELDDPELPGILAAHVPAVPATALTASETRPRCDRYGDGFMLNLRGVNMNEDGPADRMVAVRMWVTSTMIFTVRLRKVFALDGMRKEAEAGHAPTDSMGFVVQLSAALMRRVQDTVFDLGDRVDLMEDSAVEEGTPPPMELAEERRMAIRLRRYLGPQRDALSGLVTVDSTMMTNDLRNLLREQANVAKLAVEELDALISRMTAVQDHYAAYAAVMQGRNGYVLSIIAAVFLPMGFVTGLFGVNVGGMPGVETPWAFAILCLSLLLLGLVAAWMLRRLKWI